MGLFAGFGLTGAQANSPPRTLAPTLMSSNMNLEGKKSVNWVKNIERMGKAIYEFKVTLFPSVKRGFLSHFRQEGRGEFAWGRVFMCMSKPDTMHTDMDVKFYHGPTGEVSNLFAGM